MSWARSTCAFSFVGVERLDMSVFEQSYSTEGGELYAPELMLGVWLYAYALASPARGRWSGAWWRILRSVIWLPARGWTTGR